MSILSGLSVALLALSSLAASPLGTSPDAATSYAESDTTEPDLTRAERQATRVMNAGLPFVERALAEQSEFPPFGAVMLPTGKIQTLGTAAGGPGADLEEVYATLIDGLREGADAGSYQAVATFALVELRHPGDGRIINAVHVALEHQEGYCVNVYYPTVVEGQHLVLGEAFAGRRAGTFFDACARSPQEG